MTVISLVSFSGAPGATTVAMAATAALTETDAPEPVMLELAISGGVVADQYDLPTEPGLASLTLAFGADEPDLLDHAQELPGGVVAVVAPPSGSKITKLLTAKAEPLARYLKTSPETIIADCGRISATSPVIPVLRQSSLVPIVIRPSRQDFHLAALSMAEINESLDAPLPAGWIIVGPCPWSHDEIVSQYGLPIFTTIAEDPVGAEAVAGLRKFRRRSPLARSAHAFAEDLAKHLRVSDADAPLSYLDEPPPSRHERSAGTDAEYYDDRDSDDYATDDYNAEDYDTDDYDTDGYDNPDRVDVDDHYELGASAG